MDGGGVGGAVPLSGSKRELSLSSLLGSATGGVGNAAMGCGTSAGGVHLAVNPNDFYFKILPCV